MKKYIFPNLVAEMKDQHRKIRSVAAQIGIRNETLSNKLQGKTQFTLAEMKALQEVFGNCPLDYLFAQEGEDVTAKYCKFFVNGICMEGR